MTADQIHDDPDGFWIEGTNCVLCRPDWCSREKWVALGVDWKLELLGLSLEATAIVLGGSE